MYNRTEFQKTHTGDELVKMGIAAFFKKNYVMLIAFLAAVITSFFVPPDREYLSYYDFKTLSCLFCRSDKNRLSAIPV